MHIEWLIYSLQCYYYYLISLFLSLYFSMSIDTSIYPFVLLLLIIFLAGNLLGFEGPVAPYISVVTSWLLKEFGHAFIHSIDIYQVPANCQIVC